MFDWLSKLGTKVRGSDGLQYTLASLASTAPEQATFRDPKYSALLRIWNGADVAIAAEIRRRIADLPPSLLTALALQPIIELTLPSPLFGYAIREDRTIVSLSELIRWGRSEPWLKWYQRFGLEKRLRSSAELCSTVSRWRHTGFARCEWPLASLSVRTDQTIIADDPESFSRTTRATLIARGDRFAIAPELADGHRQPDPLSDTFSVGVTIYALLRTVHPFGSEGLQSDSQTRWIDLPDARRPEDLMPTESAFTARMHHLFERCFVGGRYARLSRPSADELQEACRLALDQLGQCPNCGSALLVHAQDNRRECRFCGAETGRILAFEFFDAALDAAVQPQRTRRKTSDHLLVLSRAGHSLYARHCLADRSEVDEQTVLARVGYADEQIRIENTSTAPFFIFRPGGDRSAAVAPGKRFAVPLQSRIFFERPQAGRIVKGARLVACGVIN